MTTIRRTTRVPGDPRSRCLPGTCGRQRGSLPHSSPAAVHLRTLRDSPRPAASILPADGTCAASSASAPKSSRRVACAEQLVDA